MKIPPAEIASIRERLDGPARELLDAWEDGGPGAPEAAEDSTELVYETMVQLLDLLQVYENQGPQPGPCYEGEQIQPLSGRELSELGNYGLDLLNRLVQLARGQGLGSASAELEVLAFPLGLWLARNDGEITSFASIAGAAVGSGLATASVLKAANSGAKAASKASADLLLEAANTLHEKLVVEHAKDARVLDTFEQRYGRFLSHLEDPAREAKPAQLPVEVVGAVVQVDRACALPGAG